MKCYFCNLVDVKDGAEICDDCAEAGLKYGWLTYSDEDEM